MVKEEMLIALIDSACRADSLKELTDAALAELFFHKVWAELPLTSEASDIADELHDRFCRLAGVPKHEEDPI